MNVSDDETYFRKLSVYELRQKVSNVIVILSCKYGWALKAIRVFQVSFKNKYMFDLGICLAPRKRNSIDKMPLTK